MLHSVVEFSCGAARISAGLQTKWVWS